LMPWWQALVLGLVQGATEFWPVSSSGHLELTRWAFGWDGTGSDSVDQAVDVALHLGTLVAVAGYFRHDIVALVRAGIGSLVPGRTVDEDSARLARLYVVSAIPASLAGVLFEDLIGDRLGTPAIIAVSLIVFGVVLFWADRAPGTRDVSSMGLGDALAIGAAQVLALNPGTSRSGITIAAGRLCGLSREAAARFAFVMGVPVIAGAGVWKLVGLARDGVPDGVVSAMVVGVAAATVSGVVAVWATLRIVQRVSFAPFVAYRVLVGVVVLVAVAAG
jgi:undecaprenyl-diphosphatase